MVCELYLNEAVIKKKKTLKHANNINSSIILNQGCQTHFHGELHQLSGCLHRTECNFNSLTAKEQLHLYSPKIIFAPLKATVRLKWPR